ncbi:hypothetical protein JAAARDRAFT_70219 [Jaapia argillacea MUCL 33604]|uniref:Nitrate reductase n=1 Tax=Jaapia argillacea MUCL 33604 TaxID=933084 RepID=A0A067PR95_9AGAM|nr:hypothetical protein JAAARDRAFT_70219 [Jaapia argillacea MUCL 33604]
MVPKEHSSDSSQSELASSDVSLNIPLDSSSLATSLLPSSSDELVFKPTHGGQSSDPRLPVSYPPLPQDETPTIVAQQDQGTPDNWVKRNPDLIRLTGKHPFNCEAPLAPLFDAGFLTPAHLHFVRNHGAVPHVPQEQVPEWRIRVHGLVNQEFAFSLKDLQSMFPVVTLPVTLVCAGNRRKEQNVVRKTLGFNWGVAGASTALWTGVFLADILEYVKPLRPQAKYVVFEGGDSLPQGPYGTSQRLSWAISRERGMLIAWRMNGTPLEPDHGFPVRLVVPGQIGGRSVKWLKRVEVSAQESQHHLHFWDNKILPTQVMPDQARAERHWWYDPRYIITELNVNSAIAKPDHNEILQITSPPPHHLPNSDDVPPSYTLRGYAYAGGGRRITRVEISLDEGETWTLADIEYPEDLYRAVCHNDSVYGTLDLTDRDTSFCWCFWTFEVPHHVLVGCNALMVRAMDEGLGFQPRDMYWHALGMMNNWWFRVAIHKTVNGDSTLLQFEHPTLAGTLSGGWMERLKNVGEDITKPKFGDLDTLPRFRQPPPPVEEVSMTKPGVNRKITPEELIAQDRQKPWFVVNGEVYDGTAYLNEHPGGGDSILLVAGEDASEDFFAIHSTEGKIKLAAHHIGTLTKAITKTTAPPKPDTEGAFLERTTWKSAKLVNIQKVNYDSYLYRFALPREDQLLGLPVGQHVFVRLRRKDTGEVVQRAYTPVSKQGAIGFIEFLIKLYLPTLEYPVGGKMTSCFHKLVIGDSVELKGPLGSFVWDGPGSAVWKGVRRILKEVGMICGGSGVTPILQVLRAILDNAEDPVKIWVISANKTEADILCRQELDSLFTLHGQDRFKLHYTLSKVPEAWCYSTGRINDVMMAEHLPAPSEHSLITVCGPDAMISHSVKPGLQRLGWDIDSSLVVF